MGILQRHILSFGLIHVQINSLGTGLYLLRILPEIFNTVDKQLISSSLVSNNYVSVLVLLRARLLFVYGLFFFSLQIVS